MRPQNVLTLSRIVDECKPLVYESCAKLFTSSDRPSMVGRCSLTLSNPR